MVDETSTTEVAMAETAEASAPVQKKQRAPRRAKADAVDTPARAEKVAKQRRKRVPKATQSAAVAEKPASGRRGRAAAKAAIAAPTAADDMAALLQLEEENRRLRQTLAEKLRAENADLRQRLGLA